MITKHILENLEKELRSRDNKISRLNKKVKELESIKSDWIDSQLTDRKFPEDYIKQKKVLAERRTWYEEQIEEYHEILQKMEKRHKEEVSRLKFEIELLEERLPKPKLFNLFGGNKK